MNPVFAARMKHLFFAGLVIIFISFFFTCLHSKRLPYTSVTLSGFQAAFGKSPGFHFHQPLGTDDSDVGFDGMGIGGMELALLITPRFIGIYFLVALLLAAWGAAAWLANGHNGRAHTKSITWGLLACLLLAFIAVTFDVKHANEALRMSERIRLMDYMGFGAGFWIFLGGLAMAFAGAYMPRRNSV